MTLTEFFNSLQNVNENYNLYATYSLTHNNAYRLCSYTDLYKYDKFDDDTMDFISDQSYCIVVPSYLNNEVIGLLFVSCDTEQTQYYTEAKLIPFGAGTNEKLFYKPWIITDSELDSDILRNYYPFVFAIDTTNINDKLIEFIKGTCTQCYCAFSKTAYNDEVFHKLCLQYSGSNKNLHFKRFYLPKDFDGKYITNISTILNYAMTNSIDYEYYESCIKNMLTSLI